MASLESLKLVHFLPDEEEFKTTFQFPKTLDDFEVLSSLKNVEIKGCTKYQNHNKRMAGFSLNYRENTGIFSFLSAKNKDIVAGSLTKDMTSETIDKKV